MEGAITPVHGRLPRRLAFRFSLAQPFTAGTRVAILRAREKGRLHFELLPTLQPCYNRSHSIIRTDNGQHYCERVSTMRSTTKLGRVARATSALLISWGIWLTGCIAASAAPLTLYVSPAGNDAWTGRLADANAAKSDGPLATIQRARDEIRKQKAAGQLPEVAAVVLRGGTYRLAEPLVFTPEDSGTPGHAITYSAASGEKPVLSGGRVIRGWTKGAGQPLASRNSRGPRGQMVLPLRCSSTASAAPEPALPTKATCGSPARPIAYKRDRKATKRGNREIRTAAQVQAGRLESRPGATWTT